MLRQLAESARQQTRSRQSSSGDRIRATGRTLVVLLPRRGFHRILSAGCVGSWSAAAQRKESWRLAQTPYKNQPDDTTAFTATRIARSIGRAGSPLPAETMARTGVTRPTLKCRAYHARPVFGFRLCRRGSGVMAIVFDYEQEYEHGTKTHLRIMMRQFVS